MFLVQHWSGVPQHGITSLKHRLCRAQGNGSIPGALVGWGNEPRDERLRAVLKALNFIKNKAEKKKNTHHLGRAIRGLVRHHGMCPAGGHRWHAGLAWGRLCHLRLPKASLSPAQPPSQLLHRAQPCAALQSWGCYDREKTRLCFESPAALVEVARSRSRAFAPGRD